MGRTPTRGEPSMQPVETKGWSGEGAVIVPHMNQGDARDDPVSWLLIRPGWKVVSADGLEVGQVDEVAGDDNRDIFDGLAVATSAFGKPRYVPSEQVAQITEGRVGLNLTRAQVEQLGEYLEPATQIEPDRRC